MQTERNRETDDSCDGEPTGGPRGGEIINTEAKRELKVEINQWGKSITVIKGSKI